MRLQVRRARRLAQRERGQDERSRLFSSYRQICNRYRARVREERAGKDSSLVKSYRPLTLVSSIGKLFERILYFRVSARFFNIGSLSRRQFGFRLGSSAEDAICHVQRRMAEADRYLLGVFLDIRGAFDNLWWPSVLYQLGRRGVTIEEMALFRSFFENRQVVLRRGHIERTKVLSKGSPQGSVLSPLLWSVEFDIY